MKTLAVPTQSTTVPRHGDKVTIGDAQLAWHAVDTIRYNVNLYHFAYALKKPTSNVSVLGDDSRQCAARS